MIAIAHAHGMDMPKRMSHEERTARRRKIADFIASGKSIEQAMNKFNVSQQTVENACKENQVPLPKKPRKPRKTSPDRETFWKALALLLRGESISRTAEQLEVSRQRVHQIKKTAEERGLFEAVKDAHRRAEEARREVGLPVRTAAAGLTRETAEQAPPAEVDAKYQRVIDLLNAGHAVKDAAADVGLTEIAVYRALQKLGYPLYHPHRLDDDTRFKVVRDLMGDHQPADVAKKHDVSLNAVLRIKEAAEKAGLFRAAKKYQG